MNRERLSRVAWVSAAGICLVVVITLLSQSGGGSSRPGVRPDPELHELPPLPDPRRPPVSIDDGTFNPEVVGRSAGLNLTFVDEQNRVRERVMAAEADPLPNGRFAVKRPQVLRYLSSTRVVKLASDEGRIVAPGNKLQSGELRGNLVLTVYDGPEGRIVDLSDDSPDRVLQVVLASATFDTTKGEIISTGGVRMTTPRGGEAELDGQGLRLVYNELAEPARIEYLEISEVTELRLRPPAGERKKARPSDPSVPPPAGAQKKADDDTTGQGQYYTLAFDKSVVVDAESEKLEADRLQVFFSLDSPGLEDTEAASGPGPVARTQAEPVDTANPPSPQTTEARRLIRVTGGGKMVMTPGDPPPQADRSRDMFIVFSSEARPVRISLADQTQITAATVDYLDSLQLVRVQGTRVHPMRIESPQIGRLAGDRLFVRLDEGIAQLEGPGAIRAPHAIEGQEPALRSLPPGFSILWSNSVNIGFDLRGGADQPVLRSALFVGGVRISQPDPKFELRSEQVTTHFDPASDDSQISMLDAVGSVEVDAADGYARADRMRVEMTATEDGKPIPGKLSAWGNAGFGSKDGIITGQQVDVTFRPPAERKDKDEPKAGDALARFGADVATLKAIGGVYIEHEGAKIYCDQFEADNVTGLASLFGSQSSPVILKRDEGPDPGQGAMPFELRVARLDLNRPRKMAAAEGAGNLTFTQKSSKPGEPARPVTVAWTKQMTFDDEAGVIQLLGDVRAEERRTDRWVQTIRSPQMTLELVDATLAAAASAEPGGSNPGRQTTDLFDSTLSGRELRKFTARGGVTLHASERNAENTEDLWRFYLEGEQLEYTQADELAHIRGPGRMVIMDHRPAKGDTPATAVELTGRGHTAFQWRQGISFDGLNKKMTMRGAVEMAHDPLDGQERIFMDVQELTADMTDPGHVDVIGMPLGSLDINYIEGVGGVRLEQGSRMISAHRLYYDGAKDAIEFRERPGRLVEFTDERRGESLTAEAVLWNRRTGRIEVIKPGKRF